MVTIQLLTLEGSNYFRIWFLKHQMHVNLCVLAVFMSAKSKNSDKIMRLGSTPE